MFFANGRVIKGAQPLGVFVEVVEREREHAQAAIQRGVPASSLYQELVREARPRADGAPGTGKNQRPELDEDQLYRVGLGLPGHAVGPADALLTVVVFTDFECPYCRKLESVLDEMRSAYDKDLRIIFRHQPLDIHPNAILLSQAAAAAAAQGRIWEMHQRIFGYLGQLQRRDLDRLAAQVGLDMVRFAKDMDDGHHLEAVINDRASGAALGVVATPTLFINGTPVRGAATFDTLDALYLQPKLEEARAMVAAGTARADVYATLMRRAKASVLDSLQAELSLSCSGRAKERARELYQRLEGQPARERASAYCKPHGIDVGD